MQHNRLQKGIEIPKKTHQQRLRPALDHQHHVKALEDGLLQVRCGGVCVELRVADEQNEHSHASAPTKKGRPHQRGETMPTSCGRDQYY